MKKIDSAKNLINSSSNIFKCPVCGSSMNVNQHYSLVCSNNHCFDLSKQGYINLLSSPVKMEYGRDMLEARNIICKSGFFSKMTEEIAGIILRKIQSSDKKDRIKILDVGCGEGSHLADIIKLLNKEGISNLSGVGIDISKDGIHIASREYPGIIWCVADLARNPFKDKKFDIILNIFSPSNYTEFSRILRDDGILVKAVPGSSYLKELRDIFYKSTDKETYSNKRVVDHFRKNFNLIDTKQVSYRANVSKDNFKSLIKMTPLSWSASETDVKEALHKNISDITVEMTVLTGKKQ